MQYITGPIGPAPADYIAASEQWEQQHPAGTEVIARGLAGVIVPFPRHWTRYPGWIAVAFGVERTLVLTRISSIEVTLPVHPELALAEA